MRREECFEVFGTIEIEGEQVLGSVFQHELKFAATAIVMVFAYMFSTDDATRRRTGDRAHCRNNSVGCNAAQFLDDLRQNTLGQMIENNVIAQDHMETSIGPGQPLSEVVRQPVDISTPMASTPRPR